MREVHQNTFPSYHSCHAELETCCNWKVSLSGGKVGLGFKDSETEKVLQNERNPSNIFTSHRLCHAELEIHCNWKVSMSGGKAVGFRESALRLKN